MTNLPDLNNVEETMAYLQGLDPEQKERIIASVEPYLEKVWLPQPGPQADAFYHEADELLYGGAAGGGKSDTGDDGKASPFDELDGDTKEWLAKRNVKTPAEAAKLAREQASLLGNAVRVPGENATDEEREAFLNKLGRPETPDGFEFEVPEKLPEDLPYDGERAQSFKEAAHAAGLTATQASAIHNWAVENAVADYESQAENSAKYVEDMASAEGQKLEKRWGPLDGDTAKQNMAYADRAIRETGGEELVASLKKWGVISADGKVMDENIAVSFANIGMALYSEDPIPAGDPAATVGNPFEDGEHFNMTAQMQLINQDRQKAISLIRAAGKKPEDLGLSP